MTTNSSAHGFSPERLRREMTRGDGRGRERTRETTSESVNPTEGYAHSPKDRFD